LVSIVKYDVNETASWGGSVTVTTYRSILSRNRVNVDPDQFDTDDIAIQRQPSGPNRRGAGRSSRSLRGAAPDITPVSEHLINVGRHHLRVRRSGAGPPLVLLNGMGMSSAAWQPLERHLSGFERIKIGLPGAGGMLARQPLLTMRHFASLAGGLFDELAIECTDVLGLSFGGMVAQQLAHDMPSQIRSLILVSTSCGLGGEPSNPASWWNAMLADGWPTPYAWNPNELAHRWSQVMMREFGAGWATGRRLKGFVEQILAATPWSSLPWLSQLTQQTLVIAGTADALVPVGNAGILASRIPRAQAYTVAGGGHLCALDRAAEVGPVIAAFLRSLELTAIDEAAQLG
jgi:pimeloyl-ACP methyl ester carboxylesterase